MEETFEDKLDKYSDNPLRRLGFEAGVKWQQEKSYSEEEVKNIADEARWQAIVDPIEFTKNFDKWFKIFKKK